MTETRAPERLPVCEFSDLPRLWCPCPRCDHFTMTPAEQQLIRWRDHPELRPARPVRHAQRLAVVSMDNYRTTPYKARRTAPSPQNGPTCATPWCDQPAGDAFVCPTCAERFTRALDDVPALVEDLELAAQKRGNTRGWGMAKMAHVPTPASRIGELLDLRELTRTLGATRPDLPGPADLLDAIAHALAVGVHAVIRHRRKSYYGDGSTVHLAAWLRHYQRFIIGAHDGGEIVAAVCKAHDRAMVAIDNAPERFYLGACTRCGKPMYEYANRAEHLCTYCGELHNTAQSWDALMGKVREHPATTRELVVFARIAGTPITHDAVKGLVQRRSLLSCGTNTNGTATYWIGDLLDILDQRRHANHAAGA